MKLSATAWQMDQVVVKFKNGQLYMYFVWMSNEVHVPYKGHTSNLGGQCGTGRNFGVPFLANSTTVIHEASQKKT